MTTLEKIGLNLRVGVIYRFMYADFKNVDFVCVCFSVCLCVGLRIAQGNSSVGNIHSLTNKYNHNYFSLHFTKIILFIQKLI